MSSTRVNSEPFQIGAFRVEPARNVLLRDKTQYSLEPRIMEVLCALAANAGEVVARRTLIDRLWDVDYGADESLTRAISVIRKVVREAGEDEPYIETIKKRGYRLLQPVTHIASEQSPARRASDLATPRKRWIAAAAAAALVVVAAVSLFLSTDPGTPDAKAAQTTIAVLPFRPLSDSEADGWFGDGITEELINALAAIDELAVAARTSSFSFRNIDKDIREIASDLDVEYVVEGSVRSADGKIRVAAQLIRAADGYHVWSQVLENQTGATFELQDDIVREISRALQIRLHVGFGERFEPHGSYAPEAVERYYQGIHLWGNRLRKDGAVSEAYAVLRSAVEIDPDFGEAWVALAVIGMTWSSGPLSRDKDDFVAQVKRDVERALSLRPNDHVLAAVLAIWHVSVELDLEQAQRHLERAEAVAPSAAWVLYARATVAWVVGDVETALEHYERAIRLDPLNDAARLGFANRLAVIGKTSDAFEFFDACQKADCLREGFVAYASTAAILSADPAIKQRWSRIYDEFEAILETLPDSAKPHVVKVSPAYYSIGFGQADAQQAVRGVREVFARELITDHIGIWGPMLATVLPRGTVLDTIELAYERGDLLSSPFSMSPFYGTNPYPDWVLEHPRYQALWANPDLATLATMRRANGWTDGLPRAAQSR